jgi:translation initiation factor IF-2
MEEQIKLILDQFYNENTPEISNVSVLNSSLDLGILCIRWREGDRVITVKSIIQDNNRLLTQLI